MLLNVLGKRGCAKAVNGNQGSLSFCERCMCGMCADRHRPAEYRVEAAAGNEYRIGAGFAPGGATPQRAGWRDLRLRWNGTLMQRQFDVVIERDEDGFYVASVPQLRGCH